jgi:DNA primase
VGGRPFYGRWPARTPAEGKPKTLALPGEGTKASLLYFDRARRAGLKELVLVEGLIDAALLQAKGDAGVVACMGSQFSASQLETLDHYGVRSITICLDPDGAGEKGTLACIKGLMERE